MITCTLPVHLHQRFHHTSHVNQPLVEQSPERDEKNVLAQRPDRGPTRPKRARAALAQPSRSPRSLIPRLDLPGGGTCTPIQSRDSRVRSYLSVPRPKP